MKVSACSSITYTRSIPHTSVPKTKPVNQKVLETVKEPDYGKGMKQLAFIIGMSILGVSSIMLGTRGKFCGIKI